MRVNALSTLTTDESDFAMANPIIFTPEELATEIWKDVPGWENCYSVSNLGRFQSHSRQIKCGLGFTMLKGKILKPNPCSNGYHVLYRLSKDGNHKYFTGHRIVARAFLGESDLVVNHINGNGHDNRVSNLEYVTVRGNTLHGLKNKTNYTGVSKTTEGRFSSYITINSKRRCIGVFDTPEQASDAYRDKVLEIGDSLKYVRGTDKTPSSEAQDDK